MPTCCRLGLPRAESCPEQETPNVGTPLRNRCSSSAAGGPRCWARNRNMTTWREPFQPRGHPAKLPTGLLTLHPFFRGACLRTLVAWEEERGRVREGKRMRFEKPWNPAPPRNTHNRPLLFLFQCCCPMDAHCQTYCYKPESLSPAQVSVSLSVCVFLSLRLGKLHVIQIEWLDMF